MLVEGMHYSTSASYSRERRFEALSRAETSRSTIGRINREEGNGVAREAKERLPGFRWAISRLVDRTLKKADVPRLILGRMVSCRVQGKEGGKIVSILMFSRLKRCIRGK